MGLYLLAHGHTRWTHWMGCVPLLLTLAPKGVPKTPTLVRTMGLSAPALSQADGGKPTPTPWPFLGHLTSCRLHCALGGVKGPRAPDPQPRLCPEPADPVPDIHPAAALGSSINRAARLPSKIPCVPHVCSASSPRVSDRWAAGWEQHLPTRRGLDSMPSGLWGLGDD